MTHVLELFEKGGPIMWPLLACSLLALTVVVERLIFLVSDSRCQSESDVGEVLLHLENGRWREAESAARVSDDAVAQVLSRGLAAREHALLPSLRRAAEETLQKHVRGIGLLDTIITAGPLLGLLGTVTGMIRAFSLVGGNELEAPTAITGGIAEALIATSFGLGIAIVALFPYNYLNTHVERLRHRLQDACTALEIAEQKPVAEAGK